MDEEPFLPLSEFTPTNFIDMNFMAEAACIEDLLDEMMVQNDLTAQFNSFLSEPVNMQQRRPFEPGELGEDDEDC